MRNITEWVKNHRYCLVGLYMIVFLLGFFLLEVFAPEQPYIIHSVVDDWIPFCEWFVIPYFIWYGWVPAVMLYFMIKEKESYLRLCFNLFTGATICLIVYAIWPNGLDLRREITSQNVCADVVRFLRSIDSAQNVCPSIHVSSTAAIFLTIRRSQLLRGAKRIHLLSWILTLAICLSTMFIKQHSVIDVVWGWVLSQALAWVEDAWAWRCCTLKAQ